MARWGRSGRTWGPGVRTGRDGGWGGTWPGRVRERGARAGGAGSGLAPGKVRRPLDSGCGRDSEDGAGGTEDGVRVAGALGWERLGARLEAPLPRPLVRRCPCPPGAWALAVQGPGPVSGALRAAWRQPARLPGAVSGPCPGLGRLRSQNRMRFFPKGNYGRSLSPAPHGRPLRSPFSER